MLQNFSSQGIQPASCQETGTIVKTYDSIPSEQSCQQACDFSDDCLYYVYKKDTSECQLRTNTVEKCDQVIVEKGVTGAMADQCRAGKYPTWNLHFCKKMQTRNMQQE